MGDLMALAEEHAIRDAARALAARIAALPEESRIGALNAAREELHKVSPFAAEPVDLVVWVRSDAVEANGYNPNTVAAPEMRLLEHSIVSDGYTQPIVAHATASGFEVVDGFHRSKVGRTSKLVRARVRGYLPIVRIRAEQADDMHRRASTIRHNRARGKHGVEPMSGIVAYLAKKGWDDAKISKEIGMEPDEVLRFKQVTGLAEMFADREFSEAWTVT